MNTGIRSRHKIMDTLQYFWRIEILFVLSQLETRDNAVEQKHNIARESSRRIATLDRP
jgi:hypothetical protein